MLDAFRAGEEVCHLDVEPLAVALGEEIDFGVVQDADLHRVTTAKAFQEDCILQEAADIRFPESERRMPEVEVPQVIRGIKVIEELGSRGASLKAGIDSWVFGS